LEILPKYGFDIGRKAVKIDDRVADQVIKKWRSIKRDLEEKMRKEMEEEKKKERELRSQSGKEVALPVLITVRDFAAKLGLTITEVITELMKNGILANQNQSIDFDTASIMAGEFGFTALKEDHQNETGKEEKNVQVLEEAFAKSGNLIPRPPVIVVMGHVDHGKTKLLDTIRKAHVIDTESGGITQHIGAYQTVWRDPKTSAERLLTFIDTPGHEAFTVMRSRGAKVADIAIMIVAADDGVKPQTEEVIQIIKAAKLPFIVAINKIDKEGADPQRVKTELSNKGVIPEDWGGDVPMVEISAKQNLNIDKLLDLLLLVADMNADKIKADPTMPAAGTIIDSHLDKNIGPVATVLVQSGTLRKGEPLVVNNEIYGKVRAMLDYKAQQIDAAGPSVPAQIIGFKVAPEVGDILNISAASTATKIDIRQKKSRQTGAEQLSTFLNSQSTGEESENGKKTLNLVVKTDVLGSLEAIIGSMEKIKHDEVGVKIIGKGLGNVNEDDVNKAEAGNAFLVAFRVKVVPAVEEAIRNKNIKLLEYDVIYDMINWVKEELEKMLDKEKIVTEVGKLKVLAIFRTEKGMMTVGGRIEDGKAIRNCLARVKHSDEIIGIGKIVECQTGKQSVKEVPAGTECGIRFEGKTKIEVDDILEFYTEETKARKIIFQ